MLAGFRHRLKLAIDRPALAKASLPQALANPLRHGHPFFPSGLLQRPILVVLKENLQSLSHMNESIVLNIDESIHSRVMLEAATARPPHHPVAIICRAS